MTTIVNTPPAQKESGGPMGIIFGLIVLVALVYAFFVYGLPAIRNTQWGVAPQITIPSEIDVNINQETK